MAAFRRTSRIVGVLFLIAMVASLLGGIWLETFLSAPDYLAAVTENQVQVVMGVLLELINGLAVIGIAVGMFPIFRRYSESLALGYVALRTIESAVIIGAVISPLALLSFGANAADSSAFNPLGESLLAVRSILVGQITGIFFSLAALLLFYLLYQTRLIPRLISIWGLIGVVLVFAWNLVELFGISLSSGMFLALPMILNEIFLAIWLIFKGFDQSALSKL